LGSGSEVELIRVGSVRGVSFSTGFVSDAASEAARRTGETQEAPQNLTGENLSNLWLP